MHLKRGDKDDPTETDKDSQKNAFEDLVKITKPQVKESTITKQCEGILENGFKIEQNHIAFNPKK